MGILDKIAKRRNNDEPVLIEGGKAIYVPDIQSSKQKYIEDTIKAGDVVILIGDYDLLSITSLLHLIDLKAIIVPLYKNNITDIEYNIKVTSADYIIQNNQITNLKNDSSKHDLIKELTAKKNPGIIFFSTGTTGKPKAILHDVTLLFKRFETPRPALKSINFLMFDHMGGLNTLFHTIFNGGTIINPLNRNPEYILKLVSKYKIELLPTTPTFLRMLLLSGLLPDSVPSCLKIISYGSEQMDEVTLKTFCNILPNIDFRQTYGLSEFCVLRAKSKSKESLFFKVGGEGMDVKIEDSFLKLRSKYRMVGYLNAKDPFDKNGWYNTKDIVQEDGEYIKIVGRETEIVNVGGLKFMLSEINNVALEFPGVSDVRSFAKSNPITGQHVEILVEIKDKNLFNTKKLKNYFELKLPNHMRPQKIKIGKININHRFKKIN
tara:strand:+ start:22975 stop:24276 length:1302 start_codon:yes stop_codon:yes gene_type:complete